MLPEDIYKFVQSGGGAVQTVMESQSESEIWDAKGSMETRVENLEKHSNNRVGISVQICDLDNPRYSLKRPISLLVFVENGAYFAAPIDLEIFGEGIDEISAIYDLKESIVCYFEELKNSSSKLSVRLKSKLKFLNTLIKDEDK